MSSHRHRHRHRHQTFRISILLRPNWFTPRVLTVCSVCFKIYAQCGCDLGGHRTAKTRYMLPPPLHCIRTRYQRINLPGRRHLTVPPATTLTCALILRHPSLLALRDALRLRDARLEPATLCRPAATLHLRLHSLAPQKTGHCVPSQPSHPWPTYKFHTEPWLSLTPLVAVSSLSCLPRSWLGL